MKDIRENNDSTITTSNNNELISNAIGRVNLNIMIDKKEEDVEVNDVLYVPEITTNLLSVSKIVKKGHTVTFNTNGCKITDNQGYTIATASEEEGIYKLDQIKE